MNTVPDVFQLSVESNGHPYVLSDPPLPRGYVDQIFNGSPLPIDWIAPPHRVVASRSTLADAMAWKEPFPLLSERAAELFDRAAPSCAEYRFFTETRGRKYYLMNVLASADILDEALSDCGRSESGEITSIRKHAFRYTEIGSVPPIFKLKGRFFASVFVTRMIPELVVRDGLTGFQFRDPGQSHMRDLYFGRNVNVFPGVR